MRPLDCHRPSLASPERRVPGSGARWETGRLHLSGDLGTGSTSQGFRLWLVHRSRFEDLQQETRLKFWSSFPPGEANDISQSVDRHPGEGVPARPNRFYLARAVLTGEG